MDTGAAPWVGFIFADNLAYHRRGVPLPEEQVAHQVCQGVAFGPFEVGVGPDSGCVSKGKQDRRDGIGGGRALCPQDTVSTHLDALYRQYLAEPGGVDNVNLEDAEDLAPIVTPSPQLKLEP